MQRRAKTHLADGNAQILKVEHELVCFSIQLGQHFAQRLYELVDRLIVQRVLRHRRQDQGRVDPSRLRFVPFFFLVVIMMEARLVRHLKLSEQAVGRASAREQHPRRESSR
jgi:hypothetical protein